jgi:protein-tyrosine phosphatase
MRPVNFRDVGESLALWLDPTPFSSGRLLRGGCFDTRTSLADLGDPKTILNLRRGLDPDHLGVARLQVPAPDKLENYNTDLRHVSDWVRGAVASLVRSQTEWPVYVHCTAGRDRTGVVIAAVLLALEVPTNVVVDEYLLSEGSDRKLIQRAIQGFGKAPFLPARDRAALRQRLGSQT